MEKQETKITSQDIIDKEFRVKFRGFDMAEVDAFLEEVAENFFRLTEENTVLNEKILALQQELEQAGSMAPQGQAEFPEELENALEDIKQYMVTIRAELASMKQGGPAFDSLENSLKDAVASIQQAAGEVQPQDQSDTLADLFSSFEKFKKGFSIVAAEVAAMKEDRKGFEALKNNLEEIISSTKEAAPSVISPSSGDVAMEADLNKTMDDFKQEAEKIRAGFTDLKQEIGSISDIREGIADEVQAMLASHFKELEEKLSLIGERPVAAPPLTKEKLLTAEIVEQPEGTEEETAAQDYEEEDFDDEGLEFLNEDDMLDVDKLRNVFQSVLDDEVGGSHESRESDEVTDDLLFLDDLIDDEPEPKVTFSTDEKETGDNKESQT